MREELRKIGLQDEEINIYLELLKHGSSKATTLSKKLNEARSTTYRFLESLIKKGLVSQNIVKNVKIFYPVNPERIPEILNERVEEIKEIVPKLNSLLKKPLEETNVQLFKGKEGIKSVMNEVLREKKDYTIIGEAEKFFSEIEFFSYSWVKKIEKIKIKGKILASKDQKFKIAKNEELEFLSNDLIPEITTWTYGDKTALFIWAEPLHVVLIKSKSVTRSNKKLFDYLWEMAKK